MNIVKGYRCYLIKGTSAKPIFAGTTETEARAIYRDRFGVEYRGEIL